MVRSSVVDHLMLLGKAGCNSARTAPSRSHAFARSQRERERTSHQASQPLAQSAIPALHVTGLAALLTHRVVSILFEDLLVAFPKVAVEQSLPLAFGDTLPKFPRSFLASVADRVSYHLAATPTQRQPNPALAPLFVHERAQLIQLQRTSSLAASGRASVHSKEEAIQPLFLSQCVTVLRETPKMRLIPRREEVRSW